LHNNNVDYDVFGTSWYPYYGSHGTLNNLCSQLELIHANFGKEVMVLETAYAFTYDDFDGLGNTGFETTTQPITVQGMSNAVRDVISAIADLGTANDRFGLGICYWEGTWIAASTSADQNVNRELCKKYGCGWATQYANPYDRDANNGGTMVDNNAFWLSDGTPLEALKVFKMVYEGQITSLKAD
ncbi:MAG: glycosyl hydrolase 53 family protein, partial [Clostridiales bacterium]|nr:glycosyl hydrolase 53 family protein [Clostridiales bacterium]